MRVLRYLAPLLLAAPAAAQSTLVNFEFYPGPDGVLGTGDDVPIVAPGTFVAQGLQLTNEFASVGLLFPTAPVPDQHEVLLSSSFNVPAGTSPVNLLASATSGGTVAGTFTHPVHTLSMWLGLGWGTADDLEIFDAAGVSLGQLTNVASQYVTMTSATPIASFLITDSYGGVVAIDDLEFDALPTGPQLAINGNCPGPGSVSLANCTPGGLGFVAWSFNQGPWVLPGSGCAGTMFDIVAPTLVLTLALDGNGAASVPVNIPNGACGNVHVQALDFVTCGPTNVVSL